MVKKYIKLGVGLAALVLLTGAAAWNLSAIESRNAVLNARALTILSPIDGAVRVVKPAGTTVSQGEAILVIENEAVDKTRLADLEREYAGMLAQRERVLAEAGAVTARFERSIERDDTFQKSRRLMAEKELDRARAAHRAAEADVSVARQKATAQDRLKEKGFTPELAWREAQEVLKSARETVSVRKSEVELAEIALKAANEGILVGGDRDVSESRSVSDDAMERNAGLEARLEEIEASLAALKDRIETERSYVAALSRAVIEAPSAGALLDMGIGEGGYVMRGMPVARFLDCSRTVVTALMSGSSFNDISKDGEATVSVVGRGRSYQARVAGLGGLELIRESGFVVPMHVEERRSDFAVILEVDMEADSPDICGVGRMANVRFRG